MGHQFVHQDYNFLRTKARVCSCPVPPNSRRNSSKNYRTSGLPIRHAQPRLKCFAGRTMVAASPDTGTKRLMRARHRDYWSVGQFELFVDQGRCWLVPFATRDLGVAAINWRHQTFRCTSSTTDPNFRHVPRSLLEPRAKRVEWLLVCDSRPHLRPLL